MRRSRGVIIELFYYGQSKPVQTGPKQAQLNILTFYSQKDPWKSVVSDDKARDFRDAFDTLRALIGNSDDSPALVVIHHTRKPKENEKHSGRSLLNLFAGSYVIGSVARSAFVLQPATNDSENDRVVFTCCKNNDGELGPRSVWHRKNGLFDEVESFNWEEFDKSENGPIKTSADKVVELAREGFATRSELVSKRGIRHGLGKSASYAAIKSAFNQSLLVEYDDGRITAA